LPGTTSNFGFPYPSSTDAPDGATQIQNLAEAVDTDLDSHTSDSTIHFTLGSSGSQASPGNHSHTQFTVNSDMRAKRAVDNSTLYVPKTGGAYWTVGGTLTTNTNLDQETTKWGPGTATNLSLAFTAPASGAVLISIGGQVGNIRGTASYIGWVLQEGSSYSGTVSTPSTSFHTSSAYEQVGANGTDNGVGLAVLAGSNPSLITGLTPGDPYCVTMRHTNSDAAYRVTVNYRSITVIPQP
jgi:hypothetical protein